MKALIQINSPARAYAWLLGFAVARTILDYFWVPEFGPLIYKVLVLFNYTVYLFTLYLLIPAMAGFILERVFSRQVDHSAVLRESILVWIVYPLVAIISLIAKSPSKQTIEWFRHIPTFMVENNFLPAGMIAVIPVLLVFYTWLARRYSGADWLRAFVSVLLALWVVYLLYYQYILRLFYYFHYLYGPFFAFGFFTLSFLIPLFPLAGRFHAAFGSHRIMLPRLVLISTIISLGLMLAGLLQARGSGVLPSAAQSTVHWNLRFFQLYDQTGELKAYGNFLDSTVSGRPVRQFQLFDGSPVFENIAYVTSDAGGLLYRDLLDIRIEDSKLVFDWNRADAGGDPFLETFEGTDTITQCTATLAGENYRCFLLDEGISADASKLESWAGETFLAVAGSDVSLIAFAYDDYTDGVIALGDDRRRVTEVSRRGSVISISFENGSADANCSVLAEYVTLGGLNPQPIDSPVRCDLVIQTDDAPQTAARVDGLLEWIGEAQGD